MKVYERLAQAFKAEGATAIFGMMGDGNMYWIYAARQARRQDARGAPRRRGLGHGRRLGARHARRRRCHGDLRPGVTQLATALVTAAARIRRSSPSAASTRRTTRNTSSASTNPASPRPARPVSCA